MGEPTLYLHVGDCRSLLIPACQNQSCSLPAVVVVVDPRKAKNGKMAVEDVKSFFYLVYS